MTLRCLPFLSAAALAASWLPALAQTAAPAASAARPAAVAPPASAPDPRLQTPTAQREGATIPGDLRPEEKVTPQIVVPLRRSAEPERGERADARRGATAAPAPVDDAAARCEAQSSKAARERCRTAAASKRPATAPR
jgi:hypothetical protein